MNVLDKETVALALDHIHSTASQSEALTTFNEYATPPPSASTSDSRSVTGELQGGISGIYNRFRASVSNNRESTLGPRSESRDALSIGSTEGSTKTSPNLRPANRHQKSNSESRAKLDTNVRNHGQALEKERENAAHIGRSSGLNPSSVLENLRNSPSDQLKVGHSPLLLDDRKAQAKSARPFDAGRKDDITISTNVKYGKRIPLRYLDEHEDNASGLPSPVHLDGDSFERPQKASQALAPRQSFSVTNLEAGNTVNEGDEKLLRNHYQHLEIPLHRSLSGVTTPKPALSRASSQETSVDSPLTMKQSVPAYHRMSQTRSRDMESPTRTHTSSTLDLQESQDRRVASVFSQAKSKVLSKDYWMKDENAKDCFGCGDTFSTFRRKHHCREQSIRPDNHRKC